MKRKGFFILLIVGVLLLIFGVMKFISSRTPKEGQLRVESAPTVSIFLDNKHMGRTPFKEKVTAGEYTLRLVPETTTGETSSWQGKIIINPNLLTYVNAVLSDSELSSAIDILWLEKSVAKKPELSVLTSPDGATILINDSSKGITPMTISDLESGEETLTIASPGFLTRTMKVRLTPGFKLIASFKLALSGAVPTPDVTPEVALSGTPSPTLKVTPTKSASSSAVADPKKPFVIIKDTPTGFLRVRVDATTSATEAARVKPGEKYHVVSEKSGWYEISYEATKDGWISGQYAEKIE